MGGLKRFCIWVLCLFLFLGAITGCVGPSGDNGTETGEDEIGGLVEPPFFAERVFAHYREVPVDISPSLAAYQVESGLANISNRDLFHFSPAAEELLVRNGFVVVPNAYREFFGLYEMNRYEPVPGFITTDSMLHNFHLLFSHLLRVTEKEQLAPALDDLTQTMLVESQKQYETLKGTGWENAAARNMGFFAVGGRLLNSDFPVPEVVQDVVAEELRLIGGREGIEPSPLMKRGQDLGVLDALLEDYSQYIPRGHYDTSQELEAYFKAMMWYGRLAFRLKSEDETRSAVLLTLALSQGDNAHLWEQIYQPTAFFVGQSDDLSYHEYRDLLAEIYGHGAGLEEIVAGGPGPGRN